MPIIYYSSDDDKNRFIKKEDANYTTAHDSTSGTVLSGVALAIGQKYSSYTIYRMAISFDTSGLDSSALIKSARLELVAYSDSNLSGNIMIKDGQPDYPHVTVEAGDYDIANYSGNGGTVDCTGLSAQEVFNLNLNSTGLGWISKTGYTKFLIISQDDNISEPPTGTEYISINGPVTVGEAKLRVEYYLPTGIPVVGDPTYSDTKATYTKATANISDTGGGYTERGFEYGTSEVATWAVRETGVWGATGDYSLVLPNLLPLTTYYARAYVTNEHGTDYSEWTSFTTTDVPAYGIHEESNSQPDGYAGDGDGEGIYANSNTICFYVRKVGGAWGKKYGPYTRDQADIVITDILTGGKGKYQIKFESDVLTGISASVMVKLDCKAR